MLVKMPRTAIRAPHPARIHQARWLAAVNPWCSGPRALAVTIEPSRATPRQLPI
ncbi:hypothetical protein ACXKR8_007790 [Streptacidiphilus sp. PAMC 29251]